MPESSLHAHTLIHSRTLTLASNSEIKTDVILQVGHSSSVKDMSWGGRTKWQPDQPECDEVGSRALGLLACALQCHNCLLSRHHIAHVCHQQAHHHAAGWTGH